MSNRNAMRRIADPIPAHTRVSEVNSHLSHPQTQTHTNPQIQTHSHNQTRVSPLHTNTIQTEDNNEKPQTYTETQTPVRKLQPSHAHSSPPAQSSPPHPTSPPPHGNTNTNQYTQSPTERQYSYINNDDEKKVNFNKPLSQSPNNKHKSVYTLSQHSAQYPHMYASQSHGHSHTHTQPQQHTYTHTQSHTHSQVSKPGVTDAFSDKVHSHSHNHSPLPNNQIHQHSHNHTRTHPHTSTQTHSHTHPHTHNLPYNHTHTHMHGQAPVTKQRHNEMGPPSHNRTDGRPAKGKSGICFLVYVVHVIVLMQLGYLGFVLWPIITTWYGITIAIIYNILFILLVISFYKSVATDPGTVPSNWGFYFGDENKRRRYCKVCRLWKPDRTHHCSACSRCVLNMDHHCPWINNCVGFFNRKFFIQLLLYSTICLAIQTTHCFIYLIKHGANQATFQNVPGVVIYVCVCVELVIALVLLCAFIPFTKFHFSLVTRNSTTIENMDPKTRDRNTYDLGACRNYEQVFGRARGLWWLPAHTRASRPYGDGVRWHLDYRRAAEDENERPPPAPAPAPAPARGSSNTKPPDINQYVQMTRMK